MFQTSLSVWFVCRLCRDSFGQVDAFIEHKKQKHFTQFQNTTSIVFEEREHGLLFHVVTNNGDLQIQDENDEPPIKIEEGDEDQIIPFSSEIIDEPNWPVVETKSELITYESEMTPENENNFFSLKQPEKNHYALRKRLAPEEIKSTFVPQLQSTLLIFKQENLATSSEECDSFDASSITIGHIEVENEQSTEKELPSTVRNIGTEDDLQFECKLCSKELQSASQLKIHVGICALYHEDRNRFCVICNRKFSFPQHSKVHHMRFHGTEEEKSSLFKFKCQLCSKQYQRVMDLRFHMKSHEKKKQQVTTSKSKSFKCSHPYCGKEFRSNKGLRDHMAAVHLRVKSFSCDFPNCNKNFSQRSNLNVHLRIHTGERPYKCPVDSCNEAFMTSQKRSIHHLHVHCNL